MVALLIRLRWGGRGIILQTARIRFAVFRKDEFLMRPSPCCERNEVESGCENSCNTCRGRGLFPRGARVGGWWALGWWGDTTSISPSSYLGCLGSLRENGFAAMRSRERQDGSESSELGLYLLFGAVLFLCCKHHSQNLQGWRDFFSHLLEIVFALSSYGYRSRNCSGSCWVHGLIIFPILCHKYEDK